MITQHIKIAAATLCMALAIPNQTHALTKQELATGICVVATACVTGIAYSHWVFNSIAEEHESVCACVQPAHQADAKNPFGPVTMQMIKQEIVRKHAKYCSSYIIGASNYRNYPLLWYTKQLNKSIRRLYIASFFNLGAPKNNEISALLNDLYTVKELITTDYDYIIERRQFEETTELRYRDA